MMYEHMYDIKNHEEWPKAPRAFTLVETLVAIAILTISIVGPFQIAQGVLQQSYVVRDQLIAGGLAQEGMEYVREIRDSNYIYANHTATAVPWLYGFDGSTFAGVVSTDCVANACVVDPSQNCSLSNFATCGPTRTDIRSCGNTTCTGLFLYLSSLNIYNQQLSGTQTRFTRKVQLKIVSATETEVTVTVTWNNHGTKTVVLTENLRNWL